MESHPDKSATVQPGRPPFAEMGMPLWTRLTVILGALLAAIGGLVALIHPSMLVSPHEEINGAVRTYAGYLASRNLAVAIVLIALLYLRAARSLGQMMVLFALIQFFDAGMDCWEGRWTLVPGIIVLCLLFLLAAKRLSGQSFWSRAAWIE